MTVVIKSNDGKWLEVSDVFYNDMNPDDVHDNLQECVDLMKEMASTINSTIGLASVTAPGSVEEVEDICAKMRKFIFFANGIHYEISEFVDTPFSNNMSNLASDLIALNPSDYKYVKSKFLWFKNYMSLTDLISSTMDDEDLKNSFDELSKQLDEDTASIELARDIEEAQYWKEQFEMAEAIDAKTDEIFTPEVRARWESMTEDERKEYVQLFKDELGKIYGDGDNLVPDDVTFTESGYGCAYGDNHIGINPAFVVAPVGMYSIDKMIDTMTHEMRHRYQDITSSDSDYDMSENIRDEWQLPYRASDDKSATYTDDSGTTYTGYDAYYHQPVEEDAKAFAAVAQDDD